MVNSFSRSPLFFVKLMAAAKKNPPPAPSIRERLRAWFFGGEAARPLLFVVVILAVFGAVWYAAWMKVRGVAGQAPDMTVSTVLITPPPVWVRRDVAADVLEELRRDQTLSLLDDALIDRAAAAFERQPWVARVVRIGKRHPAAIEAELEYRRPVCMVEVPGGLIPVDAEGTVLPTEGFTSVEAAKYPHLGDVGRQTPSLPGRRWPDARVVAGASVAVALSPVWEQLKLQKIVPLAPDLPLANGGDLPGANRPARGMQFKILVGSVQILWGASVGNENPGEASVSQKLKKLQDVAVEFGGLDKPSSPRTIDLRK